MNTFVNMLTLPMSLLLAATLVMGVGALSTFRVVVARGVNPAIAEVACTAAFAVLGFTATLMFVLYTGQLTAIG